MSNAPQTPAIYATITPNSLGAPGLLAKQYIMNPAMAIPAPEQETRIVSQKDSRGSDLRSWWTYFWMQS